MRIKKEDLVKIIAEKIGSTVYGKDSSYPTDIVNPIKLAEFLIESGVIKPEIIE